MRSFFSSSLPRPASALLGEKERQEKTELLGSLSLFSSGLALHVVARIVTSSIYVLRSRGRGGEEPAPSIERGEEGERERELEREGGMEGAREKKVLPFLFLLAPAPLFLLSLFLLLCNGFFSFSRPTFLLPLRARRDSLASIPRREGTNESALASLTLFFRSEARLARARGRQKAVEENSWLISFLSQIAFFFRFIFFPHPFFSFDFFFSSTSHHH